MIESIDVGLKGGWGWGMDEERILEKRGGGKERKSGKRQRGKGSSGKRELVNINVYQLTRQRPE